MENCKRNTKTTKLYKNHQEPIYESIKPRPDPVGGSGRTPPSEYGVPLPPGDILPPPPPPLNGGDDEQYGFGECRNEENDIINR